MPENYTILTIPNNIVSPCVGYFRFDSVSSAIIITSTPAIRSLYGMDARALRYLYHCS